jgi:hypothetical protein
VSEKNFELAQKIFAFDHPKSPKESNCFIQNFKGKSPFHLAVENQDMTILELFE